MLIISYQTDMPAGDQIICYLSCNVSINKGELKKKKKNEVMTERLKSIFLSSVTYIMGISINFEKLPLLYKSFHIKCSQCHLYTQKPVLPVFKYLPRPKLFEMGPKEITSHGEKKAHD